MTTTYVRLAEPSKPYFEPEPVEPPDAKYWPVFFAARDMDFRRFSVKRDALFPYQHKPTIKDYLRGLQPDIDTRPLTSVPWLRLLRVPQRLYQDIVENKLSYGDAVALLERWRAHS
jgi:hypothetical protein